MGDKNLYLKPNVIVEPLFNQWYAWSYLISPAAAAMYIANSHLKIMQSFIDAPQVHASALKNPAMMGGPFINYDASRAGEIRDLLEKTKQEQAHMLELAQAIANLDELLAEEAQGHSLEPLYEKVPEILKGYVELVYDARDRPSIRFIEGLLYKSRYYNPASQSISLHLGDVDARSFVLSTPRLRDVQHLHVEIPFSDRRLDQLFQMRETPRAYSEIKKALEVKSQDDALFSSFFTEKPPHKAPKYTGDGIKIRYFGHACVLIETEEIRILCDPLISYQPQQGISRYTYTDLPEVIDYVLITHNHQDHVMFETLLQIRYKVKNTIVPKSNKGVLIDPSLKLILQNVGFKDVKEIDELEAIDIPDGQIISLPVMGEHGDLNISAKTAYLIKLKNRVILCAADSNNLEPKLYEHLYNLLGNIDVMFIGMECDGAPFTWAYGALLTHQVPWKKAQTRKLNGSNCDKAIQLIDRFNPQQVYVYAMGQEPWLTYITSIQYTDDSRPIVESNKLVKYCRSNNIISERLFGCKEIFLEDLIKPIVTGFAFNDKGKEQKVQEALESLPPTKPINEFLAELRSQDIKLWTDGDRLRCNAPKGAITPKIKAQLQECKTKIIDFLNRQNKNALTIADLKAEAVLDNTIQPENTAECIPKPTTILLTGATGFLGTFLLSELLQQSEAEIYCLVRAENTDIARARLEKRLESCLLWQESFCNRIIPTIGDLSKPLLGLSEEEFQEMAQKIDTIYHNGAWVHHASPYSLLKATNVTGTQEVLRLACKKKVKPVHFISTISIFNKSDYSQITVIHEQDSIEEGEAPVGGYAQSKWVAEKLVKIAGDRGLPVCIYRLGPISGHSQTGIFNVNDFLYKLMLGYIQLESAPLGEMMLDILPVDYASKAIVYLSRLEESWGKAFHLIHPQPISSNILFERLHSLGYSIKRIPYEQWYAKLQNIAKSSSEHVLYPLVPLFSSDNTGEATAKSINLKFDCQNTFDGLAGTSIACPPINNTVLNNYIFYLIRNGFLETPRL